MFISAYTRRKLIRQAVRKALTNQKNFVKVLDVNHLQNLYEEAFIARHGYKPRVFPNRRNIEMATAILWAAIHEEEMK